MPALNPDDCAVAYTALYGPNDTCAAVIRRTVMDDIIAMADYSTVSGDCRNRFQNFFTKCSALFGDNQPTKVCLQPFACIIFYLRVKGIYTVDKTNQQ